MSCFNFAECIKLVFLIMPGNPGKSAQQCFLSSFFCLALPCAKSWTFNVFDFQHFSYSCKTSSHLQRLVELRVVCCEVDGMVLLCFMSLNVLGGSTVTRAQRCTKLQTQDLLPEEISKKARGLCFSLKNLNKHELFRYCVNGLREATKDFGAWNLKVAQHASGIAFVKTINIRANRLSNKFAHGMKVAHVPKETEAEVSIKKSQDLQIYLNLVI